MKKRNKIALDLFSKKYRKRVIEQRNRIRELEEEVRVLKEKLAKK